MPCCSPAINQIHKSGTEVAKQVPREAFHHPTIKQPSNLDRQKASQEVAPGSSGKLGLIADEKHKSAKQDMEGRSEGKSSEASGLDHRATGAAKSG